VSRKGWGLSWCKGDACQVERASAPAVTSQVGVDVPPPRPGGATVGNAPRSAGAGGWETYRHTVVNPPVNPSVKPRSNDPPASSIAKQPPHTDAMLLLPLLSVIVDSTRI
jgi:hypothetical protein